MRKKLILGTAAATLFLAGCADMNMSDTQRRTAIGAGAGALGTYIWSQNMEKQKREMEQATQGTGIGVTQTQDNRLKLDIPSDISFDTGRADISRNFAPVLDRFANSLRDNQNTAVRIVGHTDNTGSDAINNPLSMDRAASTRNYLTSRGISGSRIQVEGRGSYEPIASNNTSDGRSRNRRVEIFVGERPR